MNSINPKVSIVIPAYNASDYLAEAIESALAQTYSPIEVIVVNDGSKDNGATAAVAASYGEKIRYIEKENGGSSSALNCGIRNMTGEWFSWLSHDDLYYPEKIEEQIEYLKQLHMSDRERENVVLFSASEEIDGEGKLIRRPTQQQVVERGKRFSECQGNEYLIAEPTGCMPHGCSCLIHRTVFDRVGGFDESLKYLNDVDFWFRLFSGGYSIHFVPKVLVKGRIHAKQVSRSIGFSYHNPEQDMYWNRSLDWLVKNYPDRYELFVLYGINAFKKTRNKEGERAFAFAASICPCKRAYLCWKQWSCRLYAGVWFLCKQIYIKMFM